MVDNQEKRIVTSPLLFNMHPGYMYGVNIGEPGKRRKRYKDNKRDRASKSFIITTLIIVNDRTLSARSLLLARHLIPPALPDSPNLLYLGSSHRPSTNVSQLFLQISL